MSVYTPIKLFSQWQESAVDEKAILKHVLHNLIMEKLAVEAASSAALNYRKELEALQEKIDRLQAKVDYLQEMVDQLSDAIDSLPEDEDPSDS